MPSNKNSTQTTTTFEDKYPKLKEKVDLVNLEKLGKVKPEILSFLEKTLNTDKSKAKKATKATKQLALINTLEKSANDFINYLSQENMKVKKVNGVLEVYKKRLRKDKSSEPPFGMTNFTINHVAINKVGPSRSPTLTIKKGKAKNNPKNNPIVISPGNDLGAESSSDEDPYDEPPPAGLDANNRGGPATPKATVLTDANALVKII